MARLIFLGALLFCGNLAVAAQPTEEPTAKIQTLEEKIAALEARIAALEKQVAENRRLTEKWVDALDDKIRHVSPFTR